MKLINFFKHYKIRKKIKENKKIFSNSCVHYSSQYTTNTMLGGGNVIYENVNIRNSIIGFASYICVDSNLDNCVIGKFCSIACNVRVQCATHPINYVSTYPGFFDTCNNFPFGKGKTHFKEFITLEDGKYVHIGNDVWIGEGVTIKGGVTIGDGAIIGMNATVTKDVPPYAIVGGVPAKIIRYRFDEETIKKLLAIKWWDWDPELIKERREEFIDVQAFVNKYYK